jgi:hypothetical protein
MAAKFLRQLFASIVEKIGDDDQGAFLGQTASTGSPKATGAAGYKNSFSGHPAFANLFHHGMTLSSVLRWILTP